MAFSGALTITDLDDFLTPSQACIIPVRGPKKDGTLNDGPTDIHIDDNNNYYEVSTYPTSGAGPSSGTAKSQGAKALEKAEINLNDCLACSGCITSTESMLITLQSQNEVLEFIANHLHPSDHCAFSATQRAPVLSIAPQTLASLSASYSASSGRPPISLRTLLRRIRSFLAQPEKGGWRVWDTTFARHVSLRETLVEFEERKQWAGRDKGKAVDRSPFSGVPDPAPLPLLASACPGWVCYAEKAQGDMLPLLSGARSSQAVMGALVKQWWAKKMHLKPDQIYHVTAMPCYDKKLEASRSDFYSSLYSTRDVDCVLTTGELDLLLSDLGFQPFLSVADEDFPASTVYSEILGSPWPELLTHEGSSSGSYLGMIISSIAGTHHNPTRVITREIRGSTDNVEYLLEDITTGEVVFKGAKCYGFRNLQNLVRKVGKETGITKGGRGGASKLSAAIAARRRKARTGAGGVGTSSAASTAPGTPAESDAEGVHAAAREEKKLDFVEVMACPGGCVNGGGQMKPVTATAAPALSNGNGHTGMDMDVDVDEEGYSRPLPDEGVEKPHPQPAQVQEEGMRWSTKEWVSKVESIYWSGLPTPPPSPTLPAQHLSESALQQGQTGQKGQRVDGERLNVADQLADQVVWDVAGGDQAARWEFLRTRFRKVEGDVLQGSGGITHEAVKW